MSGANRGLGGGGASRGALESRASSCPYVSERFQACLDFETNGVPQVFPVM